MTTISLFAFWIAVTFASSSSLAQEKSESSVTSPEAEQKPANNTQQSSDDTALADKQSQVPPQPSSPPAAIPKKILISAGFGYRDTKWTHIEDPSNTNAKYNVDNARHKIVEGDLSIPLVSMKLGFKIQQDSGGISDIREFMGYLGFKSLSLKSERGKFTGKAHFNNSPQPARDITFDQIYQYTEVDYTFLIGKEGEHQLPQFFGFRYTNWKLPAEIAILSPGQSSGPTVFDDNFQSEFYSILYGMDYFATDLIHLPEKFSNGFGLLLAYNIGLGWGKSKISDQAVKDVKTYYSKTVTEKEPPVFTVHGTGQLGPKYSFEAWGLRAVFGIGWDWNLLMLLNMSKEATKSSEVQAAAYPNFVYQGWIARLHAAF